MQIGIKVEIITFHSMKYYQKGKSLIMVKQESFNKKWLKSIVYENNAYLGVIRSKQTFSTTMNVGLAFQKIIFSSLSDRLASKINPKMKSKQQLGLY